MPKNHSQYTLCMKKLYNCHYIIEKYPQLVFIIWRITKEKCTTSEWPPKIFTRGINFAFMGYQGKHIRPCSFRSLMDPTHSFPLPPAPSPLFHIFPHLKKKISLIPTLTTFTHSFPLLHIIAIFHILKTFIIYIIVCTNNLITIMKSFIYFLNVMEIFVSRAENCR